MSARPFRPVRWLPSRHLQTIVPTVLGAPEVGETPGALPAEVRTIAVDGENAVQLHVTRPEIAAGAAARGSLLLVHGLGGSVRSKDVLRIAAAALRRGWTVARLNLRNCGETESLSTSLYNAGQSDDVGATLADMDAAGLPRPFAVLGSSLGGNTVLRYAATAGGGCGADAVIALNPPIDLRACAEVINRPDNLIYQAYFTRSLCSLLNRVRAVRHVPGPAAALWRIRTVWRFDAAFTVPDAGHSSVEDYYAYASAGPLLGQIRVPGLLIAARNDPVVPFSIFERHRTASGGPLRYLHPDRGGHVGYWQRGSPRFWAAEAALDYLDEVLPARTVGARAEVAR